MNTDSAITDDDISWINTYRKTVVETYSNRFQENEDRFADWQRLIDSFSGAVEAVLRHGREKFHAVDEAHNELCIAHVFLSNPDPSFVSLEYEPALSGTDKSIDFRAVTEDGRVVYIDVKTIKPKPTDRWDQYERALKEGWLPENVKVLLSEEWHGGELWHNMFAARSRMLEYALELEQKITDANLAGDKTTFVLALCGEGFYWHQDELEDFVSFYRTGQHREDDPFREAEAKYIEDQRISLLRSISNFACMRRIQGNIDCKRMNWNVLPPIFTDFH